MERKEYRLIDILKFCFACLIPLLHIPFIDNSFLFLIRQYLARLGVPFFFAASGIMLTISISKRGKREACIRYIKRIGIMLLIWLIIYAPLLINEMKEETYILQIQQLIFRTPAFLWYLTAVIVAVFLILVLKNEKLVGIVSVGGYLIGTWFGGSYSWLSGGALWYERIFLTTRNGIFFGLPMMYVGYLVEKTHNKKKNLSLKLLFSKGLFWSVILMIEITIVQKNMLQESDCSMYFSMPFVIYYLLLGAVNYNKIQIKTKRLRGCSTAIYVVQYGVITVISKIVVFLNLNNNYAWTACWGIVLIAGIILYCVSNKFSFFKYLT